MNFLCTKLVSALKILHSSSIRMVGPINKFWYNFFIWDNWLTCCFAVFFFWSRLKASFSNMKFRKKFVCFSIHHTTCKAPHTFEVEVRIYIWQNILFFLSFLCKKNVKKPRILQFLANIQLTVWNNMYYKTILQTKFRFGWITIHTYVQFDSIEKSISICF